MSAVPQHGVWSRTWTTGGMPSAESAVSANMAPASRPSRPSCARHSRRGRHATVRAAQPAIAGLTVSPHTKVPMCGALPALAMGCCRRDTTNLWLVTRKHRPGLGSDARTAQGDTSCNGESHGCRRPSQQRQHGNDPHLAQVTHARALLARLGHRDGGSHSGAVAHCSPHRLL